MPKAKILNVKTGKVINEIQELRKKDAVIALLAKWAGEGWGYNHGSCFECPAKDVCNQDCTASMQKAARLKVEEEMDADR